MQNIENYPVCILAGGLGTRLGPLTKDIPKALIPIGDKPFLEFQLEHLKSLGFRRFILLICHFGDQIMDHFGDGSKFDCRIAYSLEPRRLMTGGAPLYAQPMWGDQCLLLNGDTWCSEDWRLMITQHNESGVRATIGLVDQGWTLRYGEIKAEDGLVTDIGRRQCTSGPGMTNAGAYVLNDNYFGAFKRGDAFCLERELFPTMFGRVGAYICKERAFRDIGTYESLFAFRELMGVPTV